MKITVVTPSFNQGKFIRKCLDSVRAQHGDFSVEHIILDNCSTDETIQLLEEYQANPGNVDVKIFIEHDSGQTSAINKGFSLATGDIICWLNTDEWYEEDALKITMQFLIDRPDIDVVFGWCNYIRSGEIIKKRRELFFSESMLIYYGCFIPSCTTFLRRSVIDQGILLNENFKVSMDGEWYTRISRAGFRFSVLRKYLANFVWHEDNISTKWKLRGDEEFKLRKKEFGLNFGEGYFNEIAHQFLYYFWVAIRISSRIIDSIKGTKK